MQNMQLTEEEIKMVVARREAMKDAFNFNKGIEAAALHAISWGRQSGGGNLTQDEVEVGVCWNLAQSIRKLKK